MKNIPYTIIFSFLLFFSPVLIADESISSSIDCTNIEINYVDDAGLTQEERLKKMNDTFYESLDQFELCQISLKEEMSSDTSNGEPDVDNGLVEEGKYYDSVADTEMSGTEKDTNIDSEQEYTQEYDSGLASSKESRNNGLGGTSGESGSSGKPPEDIPSANNDDAVAAQIRLAAEIEKDPEKKRKLWNEYRKYKGLPTK